MLFRETILIENPSVIKNFKEKTVIVTGAAGSIGAEIVNQIAKFNPHRIVIADQAETPLNSIQLKMAAAFPQITCEYELVDVANTKEIQSVFEKYKPEILNLIEKEIVWSENPKHARHRECGVKACTTDF